ncbi:PREDICTED: collagen alpha-1(I) chain-like, partial [Capra hircus]|uniref:collagen alpha-1(I) chain-like n=1 Tax=Capra hircus TaxID=9925 RepID=UPI0008479CC5
VPGKGEAGEGHGAPRPDADHRPPRPRPPAARRASALPARDTLGAPAARRSTAARRAPPGAGQPAPPVPRDGAEPFPHRRASHAVPYGPGSAGPPRLSPQPPGVGGPLPAPALPGTLPQPPPPRGRGQGQGLRREAWRPAGGGVERAGEPGRRHTAAGRRGGGAGRTGPEARGARGGARDARRPRAADDRRRPAEADRPRPAAREATGGASGPATGSRRRRAAQPARRDRRTRAARGRGRGEAVVAGATGGGVGEAHGRPPPHPRTLGPPPGTWREGRAGEGHTPEAATPPPRRERGGGAPPPRRVSLPPALPHPRRTGWRRKIVKFDRLLSAPARPWADPAGRSEGLTKPSNRHGDYHRKLIGQTFEWVVAATGGVRSARGYLESPKPPAPAPGRGRRRRTGINQVGEASATTRSRACRWGGGGERQTPARRGSRERRGGREGRSPGRETRPPRSRRGEDARPRDPPSGSARVAARRRHRAGGTRGAGWCGGEEAAGRPALSLLHPARPGPHRDGRRAPSASVRPPAPERGGDAGRRGRGDRPAAGKTGDPSRARASAPGRGRPLVRHATAAARRRRRHGRRIGAAAGPGSEAHQGTRPRGAADGEGTEADGRAERGTDGMRPRGADTAQPAAGVGWPRATARERPKASRGRGRESAAGAHRGISPPQALPAQGRSRGATRDEGLAPPPSRARGHRHRHPRSRSRPGRTLSRRTPAAPPPTALTRAGLPRPAPSLRAFRGTAPLRRDATGPAGAGGRHPREARRGRLGPGQGTGTRAVARAGRGERGEAGGGGEGRRARTAGAADRDAGAVRGPEEKDRATRPGPQEHQRGIPPPPAREGGPATPGAPAGPGHPRSVARDPAPPPGSVFRLSLNPEARPPGDDALERGGPDRDRTPPPAAAQGRGRARRAPPHQRPRAGEAEADRASRPDTRRRSHRGRAVPPPDRLAFGLTEALHEPPGLSRAGGSAVQGSGPPHRSVCAVRARAEPASRPLQGLIRRGLRDEGNGHASPFRLDPPERQPRSGHTRHRGGTRGGRRVEGNDTTARPQAPEGRPGALQGHHRGSHEARSHTRVGRAARQRRHSPPRHREGRSPAHAEEAKREQSAVSEDQRPPRTPRGRGRETEDQGQRPHPTPAFLTLPDGQRGGRQARAPRTDREERTRSPGTPVPRPARFRLGPGEHDHTTSIRGAEVEQGEARRGQSPEGPLSASPAASIPPHLASGESGQRPREENT